MGAEKSNYIFHIILSVILAGFMLLFWNMQAPAAFVQAEGNMIYTSIDVKAGTGTGTRENPYGDIADAIKAAQDGDIVVILSGGAFANDTNSDAAPLVIDKAITIQGEGSDIANYHLNIRCGGIVLSKDVTFKNMTFYFDNSVNPGIYANGHTLTLEDASPYEGIHQTDLYAGGLYYGNKLWGTEGEKGEIIIKDTTQCMKVGNIYAGSKDAVFSKDAVISVAGSLKSYGQIYGTNFDGTDTSGTVTIKLTDSSVKTVAGSKNSTLYFNSVYARSMELSGVQNLIIENGILQPTVLDEGINVCLKKSGILDLSAIADNESFSFTVNDIQGENGTVRLKAQQKIVVTGSITGATDLVITSGTMTPALAEVNHVYAEALESSSGEGVFTFRNPYESQDYLVWAMKETEGENGTRRQWLLEEGDRKALTNEMVQIARRQYVYDGNPIEIEVTVKDGEVTLIEGVDYWIGCVHENGNENDFTSAGTIYIDIIGIGNYADVVWEEVYIEKADYTKEVAPHTIYYRYDESGEKTDTAAFALPADKGYTLYFLGDNIQDSYGILEGIPTIDHYSGQLTYQLKGQSISAEGMTVTIPIVVNMENYNDLEVNYIISLAENKEQQPLVLTGEDQVEYGKTLTLTVTGGSGSGDITYHIINGTGEAVMEGNTLIPVKAGTVQVIAVKAASGNYYEEESEPLEITILMVEPEVKVSHTSVYKKGKTLKDVTLSYSSEITGTLQWVDAFGNPLPDTTEILANTSYRWVFQPDNGNEANYYPVSGSFILWKKSGSGIIIGDLGKVTGSTPFRNVVLQQQQEYYGQKEGSDSRPEEKWESHIQWEYSHTVR